MVALDEILIRSLSGLAEQFQCDELGYLALTTKIELPLRDRWAFLLHKMLAPHGYCIAREWSPPRARNRVDLAILKGGVPKTLVELKAMYTFDAVKYVNGNAKLVDELSDDMKVRRAQFPSRTDVYGVLLATHPDRIIAREYDSVVKYAAGINRAILRWEGEDHVKGCAKEAVGALTGLGKLISSGEMCAGRAFEVDVSVLWWLYHMTDVTAHWPAIGDPKRAPRQL